MDKRAGDGLLVGEDIVVVDVVGRKKFKLRERRVCIEAKGP